MSVPSDFSRPISITFSSITATSVTISWTQPPFSLSMDEYRVELRRVTGARQLCTMVEEYKSKMTTGISTVNFSNLQEFSIYSVTITAILQSGFSATLIPTVEFKGSWYGNAQLATAVTYIAITSSSSFFQHLQLLHT